MCLTTCGNMTAADRDAGPEREREREGGRLGDLFVKGLFAGFAVFCQSGRQANKVLTHLERSLYWF